MQNIWKNHGDSLLNCLAEAGLVDTVVAMVNGRPNGNKGDEHQLDEDQEDWNVKDQDRQVGDQTVSKIKLGIHFFTLLHETTTWENSAVSWGQTNH